jgi:cell division protein FtsN
MDNEENNLDLLDLDDDTPVETLPETTPFAAPRPRKPWLLLGLGMVVVILATYIIIRTIGGDSSRSVEINLDAPEVVTPDSLATPNDTLKVPPKPVPEPVAVKPVPEPAPQPVVAPAPKPAPMPVVENNGAPVRVVADRKEVTFNPDKPVVEQPKPVAKPAAQPAPKPVQKAAVTPSAKWFVQFGSYTTRAAAESAGAKMRSMHASLFEGKQFVVLAAQLPNGKTTYRLRVGFATSADANGFCQNAKSDGLDCYVAK